MKYPKVSAAEKYAEGPRKRCDCHDEEMYWTSELRHRAGGHWQCAVKRLKTIRTYLITPRGRASKVRYNASAKGRATKRAAKRRFNASPAGRATKREKDRRDMQRPGTARHARSHGIGLPAMEKNARRRIRVAEKRLQSLLEGNDVG